ncbi:CBS domain-containing protein [Pseudonocardia sp. CA-107938]|uniref:CBS domain-containing protein n=1 Tax=Pseudonocardia sp. CA-107938 TaxID=3240021 RepID=UPI003D90CA1B
MLVRDVMTTAVVTVGPSTAIPEAAHLLVRHGFTALPVLDPDGYLIGVVSETDLAALRRHDARSPRLAAEMALAAPSRVAEVATPDPVTVPPWADVADAVATMRRTGHRSLPVVDGQRLVGIVTRADVLRADDVVDSRIADAVRRLLDTYIGHDRCATTVSEGAVRVRGVPAAERHAVAVLVQQLPGVRAVEVAETPSESR